MERFTPYTSFHFLTIAEENVYAGFMNIVSIY